MALSQKHAGKMLVPWFNSNEWKHVKDLIFAPHSTNTEKAQALEILHMWKIRTPKLPSGVEGTLIILDALLAKDSVSEDKLNVFYGTSIMRFLNLCGAGGEKQGTFYKIAKKNNLPDWLVDLRHNLAHDQIIPSRFMLQLGLEHCLDWLKNCYWEKQAATLRDFVIEKEIRRNIESIVELYCQLNLAKHLDSNIENFEDLMEDPLIYEKVCSLESCEITADMNVETILNVLLKNVNDYVICQNEQGSLNLIAEIITADGSIFATAAHQLEDGKEELPHDFIIIWQDLMNLLYMNNLLPPLVEKLIILSRNVDVVTDVRKISSLWLAEISKSLLLARYIYDKHKDIPRNNKVDKKPALPILKQVRDENPKLRATLKLDFQYCKPVIDSISSIRMEALHDPHIHTFNFLTNFLQVCGCTPEYIQDIELLVRSYVYPDNNLLETCDQLHTIEEFQDRFGNNTDFPNVNGLNTSNTPDVMENENNVSTNPISYSNAKTQAENIPRKRWRIVKDTSIFKGCPLGILAHQSRDTNPLLLQKLLH